MRDSLRMPKLLLALCLVAAVAAADADVHARLDHGEILVEVTPVPGSDVPQLRMQGVVDAPPARVWDVIDHCAQYRERLPRIAASTELGREGNVVRCQVTVDAPWPMSNLTAVTRAVHTVSPGLYKREWKMESGDYELNEGGWTLTAFDAAGTRTLAVYVVRTKPKAHVPGFLQEFAQKKALPDVIRALRDFVAR